MRRRLDVMYEKEFQTLKEMLDQNTGKFSITIDEWRSSNIFDFDFLGITLHFYNNKFELETPYFEVEELNGKPSCSGEVLYEILMKVLRKYGIENRIESALSQGIMRSQGMS